MICESCGTDSPFIYATVDGEGCHNCLGVGQTGMRSTKNILTRNSERIRSDQIQNEGDTIPPYIFEPNQKKPVPNPEFAERFPQQAVQYFNDKELKQVGLENVKDKIASDRAKAIRAKAKEDQRQIEYAGKSESGVRQTIKKLKR